MYKVNFDAATFHDLNTIRVRVVIRNAECEFMAGLSKYISTLMSTSVAESILAFKAISFARDCGFFNVDVEGDALQVISLLKNRVSSAGLYGHILDYIHRKSQFFRSCKWFYICGSGNEVIHCIAKPAKAVSDFES